MLRLLISQYPPLDSENSFCLVVKILDSGPKSLRLKANTSKVMTRGQRTRNNNFQSHYYMAAPKITHDSTTTPTASQLSQFKVCDAFHSTKSKTHFIPQSLHVSAHKQSGQQSAHMHT
ncbi:hypothetical protein AVEN_785-1 [Araneus ventricosus]|uniref:Uncharacterized protein n=1 Tax=Araneus ventricosus TaxID=182803 RepID=A0A4Y2H7Z0_ARAVE|nr:hypothetical protein AVEN_785-1 [Araneus ventricosus]